MYQSTEEILACVRRQEEDCTTDIPLPSLTNNPAPRPPLYSCGISTITASSELVCHWSGPAQCDLAAHVTAVHPQHWVQAPPPQPTVYTCGISTITASSELVCHWSGPAQCDLAAHVTAVHPQHWVQAPHTQLQWRVNFRFTNFQLKLLSSFGALFWCFLGHWSDGLVYGHVCHAGGGAAGQGFRFEMRIGGRDGGRTLRLGDRIGHVDQIYRPVLCKDTISCYVVDGCVTGSVEIIKLDQTLTS